ncbi:nuclear transport factor 2 family protein [Cyclobacterium jeungdonense]|uniref:Nuclear transport factor 2 family protein n=1 Tax=Cyclobacterium jeungdonense TaxID=708087 RepID=A0ABT8CEI7_9BACT|nr:nuclear transport factor 2 family protein [Cyclobacterium jeungdonense]MDN3690091.1 nuclear transport factor 2 family protein [Cyclobacterium jeungdonense]
MKTTFTIALFLIGSVLYAQSSEEAAIKAALFAETTAYMNRDYEDWASHWDSSREVSFLVTNMGMRENNWDKISSSMKADMESNSNPIQATLETSDFDISVTGKQAFVVYVQNMKSGNEEYKTYEVRNLRKVKGQWKLAAMVSSKIGDE